ncbi:MAG: cytochrome c [Bdellovibrionales bacterium]|nr:cytochrome c [Bdellovibrionales bacterium]
MSWGFRVCELTCSFLPVAQQLKVKPKSFADINPEDELDPSKAFQVITNGIPESQMPSFASLSVQDRWDIAAYIFTLRVDLPEVQRPSSSLSWNQVKDMSNQNILRRLQNQGIPETEQIKELSRLRRYPQ